MATLAKRRSRTTSTRARGKSEAGTRSRRWLPVGLLVIAVGLAAVALLGPLVTGLVDYRVTETLGNQTIGLDAVSLCVVAPISLFAAVLVRRRYLAGSTVALGVGAYTSYMLAQYIVGPDYAHLPGNNERLFPLCLLLFITGWLVALGAWNGINVESIPTSRRRDRLLGRIVLPVLAFLAFGRYLPVLDDVMSSTPEDKGYLAGPNFFWVIAMLDLGVFMPLTIAACVGLLRGTLGRRRPSTWSSAGSGSLAPAVAAMAITMYVNDDPNASGGSAAFMTGIGLAFALLAVGVYWPLLRIRGASGDSEEQRR
jgi:hypothetical protein